VLTAKGASLPTIGFALTLVFAGGAAGKLVCAFIGARIGTIATVWLTEGLTAAVIVALLPLPLEAALVLLPVIGIALNGTSSVLYGSVPDLVTPAWRARLLDLLYRHDRRRRDCARALWHRGRSSRAAGGASGRCQCRNVNPAIVAGAAAGIGRAMKPIHTILSVPATLS